MAANDNGNNGIPAATGSIGNLAEENLEVMAILASAIEQIIGPQNGFALLVFPMDKAVANYISSVDRAHVLACMKAFVEKQECELDVASKVPH